MRVEINGEPVELEANARVEAAVEHSGAGTQPRGVAVAVDGEVVPRGAWGETELREGQRVEVVAAVQGG